MISNFQSMLLLLSTELICMAQGFVIQTNPNNIAVFQQHQPRLQWQQQRGGFPLFSKYGDNSYDDFDDDDDEEDDETMNIKEDTDWRDFRAKLVMSESSSTKAKTIPSPPSSIITDDDDVGDLDGIGAIFSSDDASLMSSTSQSESSFTDASDDNSFSRSSGLDLSQWAYEATGNVIEKGTVILGGIEQDFGFGLRQQYFHKAVILVLDHDENVFTKGIILNRPTDLTLDDDINEGVQWRVWFGGDVQAIDSAVPDIVCLHSLKDKQVTRASIPIMKDIQWTTFDNAKRLVNIGAAKPTDFWVFAGYAGWGPQQLMGELERKSWYMVATDSQTLLKELARQSSFDSAVDVRDAGLDTWTLLMNMIGRGDIAKKNSNNFDDLMLKEWALNNLLSTHAGGGAGEKTIRRSSMQEMISAVTDPLERLINRVQKLKSQDQEKKKKGAKTNPSSLSSSTLSSSSAGDIEVKEGALLRASSAERSPFLLKNQEYHKSVILVISQDEMITVGVILNRPAKKGLDIQLKDTKTGVSSKITIPLRFGGQYSVKGTDPLLWLHNNPLLKTAQIGSPVSSNNIKNDKSNDGSSTFVTSSAARTYSNNDNEYWKCTAEDVINAISRKLATPEDFIVVNGVSVWAKKGATIVGGGSARNIGTGGGIIEEVLNGRFELIPKSRSDDVWNALSKQKVLTDDNLDLHIQIANEAWECGAAQNNNMNIIKNGNDKFISTNNNKFGDEATIDLPPISGLGDGYDEEDDSLVFKSNVKVSELSDDALKSWIATFLLQNPTL